MPVLPTFTLPKLRLEGPTARVPVRVLPTPLNDIFADGLEAFDVTDNVDVNVPAVEGAKVTDRFTLAPAARVYGNATPVTVKADPVALAAEILTLDPAVLEHVSICVWLLPTVTVPRFMVLGENAKVPTFAPVPLSETFSVGLEAFEVIDSVDENVPAVVGAKVTDPLTLAPAARV